MKKWRERAAHEASGKLSHCLVTRQPCTMKAAATRSRRSAYAAIGAAVVVRRCRGADLSYRRADCSMPSPFDCCGRGRAASRRRAFFGCHRRRCLQQPDGAGPCSIDCGIRCMMVWSRRTRAHCLADPSLLPKSSTPRRGNVRTCLPSAPPAPIRNLRPGHCTQLPNGNTTIKWARGTNACGLFARDYATIHNCNIGNTVRPIGHGRDDRSLKGGRWSNILLS